MERSHLEIPSPVQLFWSVWFLMGNSILFGIVVEGGSRGERKNQTSDRNEMLGDHHEYDLPPKTQRYVSKLIECQIIETNIPQAKYA